MSFLDYCSSESSRPTKTPIEELIVTNFKNQSRENLLPPHFSSKDKQQSQRKGEYK